ncbi:MAG TPA: bifunctional 3,4-dihydroxy-2-butanone-4-phosphate synthase/GTP cyclohydrolase II [Kiritimatiellia bacterium]|nr:bifunctional 3,4-dihydroxy-2-butanone-4-phosphate synthase/GTP cyclohydrolase II [Kiritimatiellia bacterium]
MTKQKQAAGGQQDAFDSMEDVLAAMARGEMVLVLDDERRENEGDLIIAAEKATPAAINFMARHGCGLICVALEHDQLTRLGLARMIPHGSGDPFRTAFMESVDARHGISTGISAHDRARTISLLVDPSTKAADLMRPGHVFPLEAVEGGVLRRPGHTEAAVDLARLAGLHPSGVICEVLREDGEMARRPDLFTFARKHKLRIITVNAIAQHRRRTETLIALEEEINLPTDFGIFRLRMYHSRLDNKHHLALVMGDPAHAAAPLVRVHSECLTGDAFGSLRCDCGSQLQVALRMIADDGNGVLLYLRQEGRGIGLEQKIRAYALQEEGLDTVEANEQLGFEADARDYAIAAQMLRDIGIQACRLLTNNPRKVSGLETYDIAVAERVPLVRPPTLHNERYLETKRAKLGHLL